MKKKFLLISVVTLPLLTTIPVISSYASLKNSKVSHNNADAIVQTTQIENHEICQFTWGDIIVECELSGDGCKLIKYVSGSGKLILPDWVEHNGKVYYVKEILANWSYGATGTISSIVFTCRHLEKICGHAVAPLLQPTF